MAQTKIARGNTDAQAPPIVLSLDGLSKLLMSLAEGTDPEACVWAMTKTAIRKFPNQEPLGAIRNP